MADIKDIKNRLLDGDRTAIFNTMKVVAAKHGLPVTDKTTESQLTALLNDTTQLNT